MAFQSSVTKTDLGAGVVGELAYEGPLRAKAYTIVSGSVANNVVGRAFTVTSEGVAAAGGTGVFAGILANPKTLPYNGITGIDSGALTIANGTIADLVYMGEIFVTLPGAAAIGDAVKYTNATGVLGTGAPGGGETAIPNAVVVDYTVTGAGIAIIKLTN